MRSKFSDKLLHELGAWEYGLKLISDVLVSRVVGIDTPTRFAFDLMQHPSQIVSQIQPWGSDWVIKYSCCGEHDFSHSAKRGDNSSLGRTIHLIEQRPEFVSQRLERLFYHAPQHTAMVVFQEFIDQSDGCLFHADLTNNHIELEVLFGFAGMSHRVLAISDYGSVPSIETSGSKELSKEELHCVSLLFHRLGECRDVLIDEFICDYWAVEGFGNLLNRK